MKFKTIEIFILICCFLISGIINSFAELSEEKWNYFCSEVNKNDCSITIASFVENDGVATTQTLGTVYLKFGTNSEKKKIPVLFVDLPLNVDLRINPLVVVNQKKIVNLNFMNCNQNIGCNSMKVINEEVVEIFKKADFVSIYFKAAGSSKNLEMKFPLKGFTKSYKKLSKI